MELIYCYKCGKKIPPGGIDEGKRYLVNGEPLCPKCYAQMPEEEHTGDTVVAGDAVPLRPKTGKLVKPPPKRPSSRILPAAAADGSSSRPGAAARLGLAGGAVLVLVVFAAVTLGWNRPAEPPPPPPPAPRPVLDRPPPPPPAPDDRDRRGREVYEQAREYWQKHPADYGEALARFDQAAAEAKGTQWRTAAEAGAGEVRSAREGAAGRLFEDLKARADRLSAAGDYDAAAALYGQAPPAAFEELLRPRLAAERGKLGRDAEARLQAVLDAAERLSKDGQPEKGLAELDGAKPVRYAAWDPKLAALRERLGREAADGAGKARKQQEARARELAEGVLERFERLALAGEWKAAADGLANEQAKLDPEARAVMSAELAAAARVGRELSAFEETRKAALEKLAGREAEFRLRAGGQVKGKVLAVGDAGLKISVVRRMGDTEVAMEQTVPFGDLADGELHRLLPAFQARDADGQVAAAAVGAVEGNLAGAEAALRAAGDHPLAARWARRLEALKLGAREAAAERAWKESVAKLVREKCSEAEGRALSAALEAFVRDHGGSAFAKAREAEIARLRAAAIPLAAAVPGLFKGQVVRFDPQTLEIELFWDFSSPEQLQDFKVEGNPRVEKGRCVLAPGCKLDCPAVFKPRLRLCSEWTSTSGQNYGIAVGTKDDGISLHWDAQGAGLWRKGQDIATAKKQPGTEIHLTPGQYTVMAGGKQLFKPVAVAWPEVHFLLYSISAQVSLKDVRVIGTLDRAWLEGALAKGAPGEKPTRPGPAPWQGAWKKMPGKQPFDGQALGHCAVAFDTRRNLYLAAGEHLQVWAYGLAANKWEQLSPAVKGDGKTLPTVLVDGSLAYDPGNDALLFHGGCLNNDRQEGGFLAFDLAGRRWKALLLGHQSRAAPLGLVDGAPIRYTGSRLDRFDRATGKWTALPCGNLPPARESPGSKAMVWDPPRKRFLLFSGGPRLNDTWAYDPARNEWSELQPAGAAPSARQGHTMCHDAANDLIVMHGGWEAEGTWVFDPRRNSWFELQSAEAPPKGTGFLECDPQQKCVIAWSRAFGQVWTLRIGPAAGAGVRQ